MPAAILRKFLVVWPVTLLPLPTQQLKTRLNHELAFLLKVFFEVVLKDSITTTKILRTTTLEIFISPRNR